MIDLREGAIVSTRSMKLNVLYFAHVRAQTGCASEQLEAPEGATAGEVVDLLVARYPGLDALRRVVRVAVDGEFVALDAPLTEGSEFVLIPPVAGGDGFEPVALTDDALDEARLRRLEAYVSDAAHGAVLTFSGKVRNHARGRQVTRLFYEAYGTMAVKKLAAIVGEVEAAIPGTRIAIHHRTGMLEIGDVAVLVAVGSAHRREAFEACQRLIDRLKEDVPIWKREVGPDGEEWVSERP